MKGLGTLGPVGGRKSGMKVIAHLGHVSHGYRLVFKMGVKGLLQLKWLPWVHEITMHNLARGMHARIGASSCNESWMGFNKFDKRRFKQPLHRHTFVLFLPSHQVRWLRFLGHRSGTLRRPAR